MPVTRRSLRDWTAFASAAMLRPMPHVAAAPPDPACTAALPGCDFADAFAVFVPRRDIDPARVNQLVFGTPPGWVSGLMAVRNAVMGRLGYKAPPIRRGFPVLERSDATLLSGLDDAHLDFRAFVRIAPEGAGSRIILTTAVKTHNPIGRVYLATIMPFHKLIVRSLMARLAARLAAETGV